MRTTSITVHNSHRLGIFTELKQEGFEIWIVGEIKGERLVLQHVATHDDFERKLTYSEKGDLIWTDANASDIPAKKHIVAAEMEKSISRGSFVDPPRIVDHFAVVNLLPLDRKILNSAKKAIIGRWYDDNASFELGRDSRLTVASSCEPAHPLNYVMRAHGVKPDSWSFENWQLHIMNSDRKCGERIGVLRVDSDELHFYSCQSEQLAHVFKRV
jgi:hypothetical protein